MTRAALIVYEDQAVRYHTSGIIGVVLEHPTGTSVEWRFKPAPPPDNPSFLTRARALEDIAALNHWRIRVRPSASTGSRPTATRPSRGFGANQFVTPREWMARRGLGEYGDATMVLVADDTDLPNLYRGVTRGGRPYVYDVPADIPGRLLVTQLYRAGVSTLTADGWSVEAGGDGWTLDHARATVEMLMDGIVGDSFVVESPGAHPAVNVIRVPYRLADVLPEVGDREAAIADRMLGPVIHRNLQWDRSAGQ